MNPHGWIRIADNIGRITIPRALRELFGIQSGDPIQIVPTEEGILIKKVENFKLDR